MTNVTHKSTTSCMESDFEAIVKSIYRSYEKNEVDKELIEAIISFNEPESLFKQCYQNTYSLNRRITKSRLIGNFAAKIKESQSAYRTSVMSAFEVLQKNVQFCGKVDKILGVIDSIDDDDDYGEDYDFLTTSGEDPKQQKDGSYAFSCPIHRCTTITFKLRRHLQEVHKVLDESKTNFAISLAKQISRNNREQCKKQNIENNFIQEVNKNKNKKIANELVSRKYNYKECSLCKKIYLNLPDHLIKTHKINKSHEHYDSYVREPPTIPICYTKEVNGVRVKLADEELKKAMEEFGETVRDQSINIDKLKTLRSSISNLQNKIKDVDNLAEYREIKEKLEQQQAEYKSIRYKDERRYSTNVLKWKDAYLKHLSNLGQNNPERIVRMAVDVLIPYEQEKESLQFNNLLDCKLMREIINIYRSVEGPNSTTKLKYIRNFQQFVKFIASDVSSPEMVENSTNEEIIATGLKLQNVMREIDNQCIILGKQRGSDIIVTKQKAKSKLLTSQELDKLTAETHDFLCSVLEEFKADKHLTYNQKQISKVRNSLIIIGALRLGNRTTDLTKMKLSEVQTAEERIVNGEKYRMIIVKEHKNTSSTGEPATVPYKEVEFEVLNWYIRDLRSKITNNKFCDVVFPAFPRINSQSSNSLSLSAVHSIMQRLPTDSGKKVSSRVVRGSRITNSRGQSMSESQKRDMAKAMNHSFVTAEKYYDYSSLTDSVVKTLETHHTSTPSKSVAVASCSFNLQSSPIAKRTLFFSNSDDEKTVSEVDEVARDNKRSRESDSSDDPDITLKNLRSKKIKSTASTISDVELAKLKEKIIFIMEKIKDNGELNKLRTEKGKICVRPITSCLSKEDCSRYSTKIIRKIISENIDSI